MIICKHFYQRNVILGDIYIKKSKSNHLLLVAFLFFPHNCRVYIAFHPPPLPNPYQHPTSDSDPRRETSRALLLILNERTKTLTLAAA
jgi:hypothetical protein